MSLKIYQIDYAGKVYIGVSKHPSRRLDSFIARRADKELDQRYGKPRQIILATDLGLFHALKLEREYIAELVQLSAPMYNRTDGGDYPVTKETRVAFEAWLAGKGDVLRSHKKRARKKSIKKRLKKQQSRVASLEVERMRKFLRKNT